MEGAELDKKFTLQFSGNANLASARASKFLQLQRVGRVWRDIGVPDPDNKRQRAYVDADKSPKQSKKEMLTKRLAAVVKESYPGLDVYARRRQGEVTLSWLALARIVDLTADSYRIEWNIPEAAKANIDKDAAACKLAERERKPGAEIEWG